jgi:hypothetical protein
MCETMKKKIVTIFWVHWHFMVTIWDFIDEIYWRERRSIVVFFRLTANPKIDFFFAAYKNINLILVYNCLVLLEIEQVYTPLLGSRLMKDYYWIEEVWWNSKANLKKDSLRCFKVLISIASIVNQNWKAFHWFCCKIY